MLPFEVQIDAARSDLRGNCLFILITDSPPCCLQLYQVTFKPDLSTAEVHDENIKGPLKVRQERWRTLLSQLDRTLLQHTIFLHNKSLLICKLPNVF